jgi:hypothetical protein
MAFSFSSAQTSPGIAGLIVVSGRVRADMGPENPNVQRMSRKTISAAHCWTLLQIRG